MPPLKIGKLLSHNLILKSHKIVMIEYFIIFIILLCLILFNWIFFSFNYNLLLCISVLVVIFYSNIKYVIHYLFEKNIQLNADSFYKSIIKRPLEINNDISLILYKIRIFFPYDKKNYKYLLHNADKLSYYINNRHNMCDIIYKEKLNKYCNRILNAYNSIGHSLPDKMDNYNKLMKELQNLMYSYTHSVNKYNIKTTDKMSYSNNQFNKYLL